MIWLNRFVGLFVNPFMIGVLVFLVGYILLILRKWKFPDMNGRISHFFNILGVIWFWFWGCSVATRLLGVPLEKKYPPALVQSLPQVDAVVLLGGGISVPKKHLIYPEMHLSADRAWHAARIYKSGRAPFVVTTGIGSSLSDRIVLKEFGVPEYALIRENDARNTEEHVALVEAALHRKYSGNNRKIKILLVTSAWHMRRALLNFSYSNMEIYPAAVDHECMLSASNPLNVYDFVPNANSFLLNTCIFKEYLGYHLYQIKYWFCGVERSTP